MRSDYSERPAFETIRPRRQTAPFVFNSPHSGRDYPQRFLGLSRLDPLAIRQSEDAYVDELVEQVPHLGMPLLRAHFPRAYLDVNREPYELDPKMFDEPLPPRFNTRSPRVAAGLGTIARNVSEARPIYHGRLSLPDALMRIEGIYRPYHCTLQGLITETHRKFGLAILVDCHSMPRVSEGAEGGAPDIVLGDRYGSSCMPALVDFAETMLTAAGLRVARNRPYAGGYVTRTYGRPAHGLHTLQVEVSRHLYMQEGSMRKHDGFGEVQAILSRFAQALAEIDWVHMQPAADNRDDLAAAE